MKIHPVTHGPRKNRWCGPAALSILTGKLTDDTAQRVRDITGRRHVVGMTKSEMVRALKSYDLIATIDRRNYGGKPTLAAWLRGTPRPAGEVWLIVAGGHFQVVTGRRYCCSLTEDIVSVRHEKVKRRARVTAAWRIERQQPA